MSGGAATGADWAPSATIETLRLRASVMADIRAYFAEAGVLEVETPLLARNGATDPHIHSLTAEYSGKRRYLQTSPEFAMKRLLAAGSGPIYQICKAFRDDPLSPHHAPEFTMLEWYRPGFTLRELMQDVGYLLRRLAPGVPQASATYQDVFCAALRLDPHAASNGQLRKAVMDQAHVEPGLATNLTRPDLLDLLFGAVVQPTLSGVVFVHDYPACQAALAQLMPDGVAAQRFEVFVDGLELANGYLELKDAREQRRRMHADNAARHEYGYPPVDVDERLLAALAVGIGDVAGVALGVDRLLQALWRAESLAQVGAFGAELSV